MKPSAKPDHSAGDVSDTPLTVVNEDGTSSWVSETSSLCEAEDSQRLSGGSGEAAKSGWCGSLLQCCIVLVIVVILCTLVLASTSLSRVRPVSYGPPSTGALLSSMASPLFREMQAEPDWGSMGNDMDFLLDHGVDTNTLAPYHRVKRIDRSTVELLSSHVERHRLVEGWDNLLFIGIVNYGFIDMAYNWICFMQRQGLTNYLLGAVDAEVVHELTELGYGQHVISLHALFNDTALEACGGDNRTHNFRSECFNRQTKAKTKLVITALFAHYNVILSDMDISIIHNPLLYMPLNHTWEMQLEPLEWCTGWSVQHPHPPRQHPTLTPSHDPFTASVSPILLCECRYYNRASVLALRMQHEVLDILDRNAEGDWDDQVAYNKWIKGYRQLAEPEVKSNLFAFNRIMFPIGNDYGSPGGVIQHNNWLVTAAQKRERQRDKGFYLYNQTATAERMAAFLATSPDAATLSNHSSLLVCERCVVCEGMNPEMRPLRASYPGPIIVDDVSSYGAKHP